MWGDDGRVDFAIYLLRGLSTIARERLKRFTMRIKKREESTKVLSICWKLISRLLWLINYVWLWNKKKKIFTTAWDRFRSFSAKIHSTKEKIHRRLKFNGISVVQPFECSWNFTIVMHVLLLRSAVNVVFCEAFEIGVLLSLDIDLQRFYGGLLCLREIREIWRVCGGFFFHDIHSRSYFRHHKSTSEFREVCET